MYGNIREATADSGSEMSMEANALPSPCLEGFGKPCGFASPRAREPTGSDESGMMFYIYRSYSSVADAVEAAKREG